MPDNLTSQQFDFASRHLGVTILPGGMSKEDLVGLSNARQIWDMTRQSARDTLVKLEQAILTQTRDESYFAETAAKTPLLFGILDSLDDSLSIILDNALSAQNAKERSGYVAQARSTLAAFQSFVKSDPLLAALSSNPFIPVTLQDDLQKALVQIAKRIG